MHTEWCRETSGQNQQWLWIQEFKWGNEKNSACSGSIYGAPKYAKIHESG